ncbi:MAG: AraC family transcriptional regulator [Hespellia sp.]|nr:AraC family transcriptional regulator [Hespellia sp.]
MISNEHYISPKSDYYVYTASSTAKNLFFYPVHLGNFYYEPGYFQHRDRFDSFLLMLVIRGCCDVTVGGQTITATEGTLVLLDCYAPHEYGSMIGWEAMWIHFDGPMARRYYEHIHSVYGTVIVPESFQNMRYLFDKICKLFRSGSSIREPILSKYISNILTEVLMIEPNASQHTTIDFMDTVITHITEHFKEAISLSDLAEMASLSPFYFTRLFTRETGMSPHQYLIATRMSYAKYMLKSTSLPIKEIAFDSGFSSESGFCSAFKKHEHITPSQYRNS